MNLKKKCKVVLLPTTDESSCISSEQMKGKIFYKTPMFTQKLFHLYILSDDKIEEGDSYFTILDGLSIGYNLYGVFRGYDTYNKTDTLPKNVKKIISSTDPSLNLPQPSPQFIQKYCDEYNKDNQIVEIMVEYIKKYNQPVTKNYEKTGDLFITEEPKVDKNNYITITKLKEHYTLKEISDAFKLEGIHYTENFLYKILNKQDEI